MTKSVFAARCDHVRKTKGEIDLKKNVDCLLDALSVYVTTFFPSDRSNFALFFA